ncbi:MAG TPA: tRNA pseudouridine(55) synthase TruB, partial [Dehalococcoidia bacterium]
MSAPTAAPSGGILNFNKPRGRTSFSVIGLVRRGTAVRRVGHAGTLDPMAEGVLLVCIGPAVRITEYLMDLPKVYRGTVRLGIETNTYDAEGEVLATHDVDVGEEALRQALATFSGEIEQRPPAHSAIKVGGRPAYERARRGEEIELAARNVTVYRLDLLRFDPPDVQIEVECSRGTYVRSLAHDLGQSLGCGG